jgi:hypothetical protein
MQSDDTYIVWLSLHITVLWLPLDSGLLREPGIECLLPPFREPPVLAQTDDLACPRRSIHSDALGLQPVLLPRDAEALVSAR